MRELCWAVRKDTLMVGRKVDQWEWYLETNLVGRMVVKSADLKVDLMVVRSECSKVGMWVVETVD